MARTRVSPCTTPDFSNRYTDPNSNNRSGSSRYERPRERKIRLCIGQFIALSRYSACSSSIGGNMVSA